jgi:RecJ-like exonuclease
MIATVDTKTGVVEKVTGGKYIIPDPKQELKQDIFDLQSSECPDCKGHPGVFRFKILSFDKIEAPCTKCRGGYVAVKCNNCIKGKLTDGTVCSTCKGTGTYIYKPTKNFPEGKKCKYCHGTGKVSRKTNVVTEPIKCRLCEGTGRIEKTQKSILFNPLLKKEDLDKMFDKIADVVESQGLVSEIPEVALSEIYDGELEAD